MKKRILAWTLILIMLASLAACSGAPELLGKYVNPEDSDDWVEFKEGGKITTSIWGSSFDGTFTVKGKKVAAIMKYMDLESEEEFILSDNDTKLTDQSWVGTVYIKQ